MKNKKILIVVWLLSIFALPTIAQTLPVGQLQNIEDAYRRQQLLGNDTSKSSFMIRPMFMSNVNQFDLSEDEGAFSTHDFRKLIYGSSTGGAALYALPVVWQQQYNTHHPYGWNDGAMVPAKGYQTLVSAGFYAKLGPLSIQLKPEFVFAQNKDFVEISEPAPFKPNVIGSMYNNIDLPEKFGNGTYSKFNWGQSSIRLNVGPMSLGLSNENLWWGPGVRNSLLMSNNASGFKHLTLNTTRPVNTPIGSFEVQLISGKLEKSGYPGSQYITSKAKPDDWRYLSGLAFVFNPKWVPGLYLGFDRSYALYSKDLGTGFFDYFPVFSALEKVAYDDPNNPNYDFEDAKNRDQYFSLFARWVMPESHAEVYAQYGKTDHNKNLRDILLEPESSRAYILGFRKLVPLAKSDEYIQVGLEVTQMEKSATKEIRTGGIWYTHSQVLDGYTNRGQVLGAGIGPGSNLQSLDINWVKGLKKIGLQLERLVNNNDWLYRAAPSIRRHWVDLSATGKFDWTYKNFIFNSQLTYIRSLNYQYVVKESVPADFWNYDFQDANNVQLRIGLMYRW
ncbi:capsule assembly Wzi family protein [Pedobacter sp. UC225_61]|uniref:capsule assembly Wzi family protein n=1 Tax=Pedobacter sp. UC225_61 TaxID=3374623 RepID=UPI0037A61139